MKTVVLPPKFIRTASLRTCEEDKDSSKEGMMASDGLLLRLSGAWQDIMSINRGVCLSNEKDVKEAPNGILQPLRFGQIPKPLDPNHDVPEFQLYVGQVSKGELSENETTEVSEIYKPFIAFEIDCGVHHEVWDPPVNGVYEIEGGIAYNETRSDENLFTLPFHLVGITIEVSRVTGPNGNSRGPTLAQTSISFKTSKKIKPFTSNSKPITMGKIQKHVNIPSKKDKAKESPPKLKLGNLATVMKGDKLLYVVPLETVVPARAPALKLTIGKLESRPRPVGQGQRLSFAMEIPVGPHGLRVGFGRHDPNHITTRHATTVYSLKAKGTAKGFVCGKMCEHTMEASINISVTILQKREVMDGEVMSLMVSGDERERRRRLCVY